MDLVLLSGGIESTTLLKERQRLGPVTGLFVNYGQRAARQERMAARHACQATGARFLPVDVPGLRAPFLREDHWVAHVPLPARNLLAISLAANVALHTKARTIFVGLQQDDATRHDSGARFLTDLAQTLQNLDLALETPYRQLGKTDVMRRGLVLGVDYAHTYSCLLGHPRPCGRCPQCRARQEAWNAVGPHATQGCHRPPDRLG
ncbi:MAG: 7-cyano-7-deazaguanine synthase [Gammaproteobacteria bacterium]|nr:7-cyano-7-deazaguanine synthase [Gammaproteobacteria bacterium]